MLNKKRSFIPKMSYQVIQPCQELKSLVSHFWVGKLDNGVQSKPTYYSTANTHTELAFAFKPSRNYPEFLFSAVQGHTDHAEQIPVDDSIELFGASLYSYAVPGLLHISAAELINQFTNLDTILEKDGRTINEKIAHAAGTADRIKILTGFFKSQMAKSQVGDNLTSWAVQHIRMRKGNVNIRELAAECCLSQKQFERRFTAYTGFNPKMYSRIIRFEAAFWNCRRYDSLTEAAYAHGYYDQAHFIHDFKQFSGYPPLTFFSLAGIDNV
jgi:AraC-like DNA-binding protein